MTIWIIFSIANTWIVWQGLKTPIDVNTPLLVYKWYERVYKVCYSIGSFGYFMGIFIFFGLAKLIFGLNETTESSWFNFAFHLFFYGLYFGVLGRDFVDRLSDKMALNVGFYNPIGFPKRHLRNNMCAVCGNLVNSNSKSKVLLDCQHIFHEPCIRGWCIIGKKDCCPYCKEKVDTTKFQQSTNPWETQEKLYLSLLDGVRYFLVWQPIIFIFAGIFFKLVGWE
jgi:RING finger protein 121